MQTSRDAVTLRIRQAADKYEGLGHRGACNIPVAVFNTFCFTKMPRSSDPSHLQYL